MAQRILTAALAGTLLSGTSLPVVAGPAEDAAVFSACADYYGSVGQLENAALLREAKDGALAKAGLGHVEPAPLSPAQDSPESPAQEAVAATMALTTCTNAVVTAHLYTTRSAQSRSSFSTTEQIPEAVEGSYPRWPGQQPDGTLDYSPNSRWKQAQ